MDLPFMLGWEPPGFRGLRKRRKKHSRASRKADGTHGIARFAFVREWFLIHFFRPGLRRRPAICSGARSGAARWFRAVQSGESCRRACVFLLSSSCKCPVSGIRRSALFADAVPPSRPMPREHPKKYIVCRENAAITPCGVRAQIRLSSSSLAIRMSRICSSPSISRSMVMSPS